MSVRFVTVDADSEGQRVDNFLFRLMKGVPKSRIYRALRHGEVRVNKKRVKAHTRLVLGDVVRIPPIATTDQLPLEPPSQALSDHLQEHVVVETTDYIVVNKPSGLPVHGGSGSRAGLIELLRLMRGDSGGYLELVHRLDKATSGCLLLAKNRTFLTRCHDLLNTRRSSKTYHALVMGRWEGGECRVEEPLLRYQRSSGESAVRVDAEGKPSITIFRPLQWFDHATLVEAIPVTGRMHQIRVHAAHIGRPIAQDDKYGDGSFNSYIKGLGLSRLFLHAISLVLPGKVDEVDFGVCVPLSSDLQQLLNHLN